MIGNKVLFKDNNFKQRTGIIVDKILKSKPKSYPTTHYIIETVLSDGEELLIVTPESIESILEKKYEYKDEGGGYEEGYDDTRF